MAAGPVLNVGRQYFEDEEARRLALAMQEAMQRRVGGNPTADTLRFQGRSPTGSISSEGVPENPLDRAGYAVTGSDWFRNLPPEAQRVVTGSGQLAEFVPPVAAARGGYEAGAGAASSDYGRAALGLLESVPELKGSALAAGLILPKGVKDPRFWSDLSKTKHTIPIDEMQATQVPTGTLSPRKIIEPADLQGSVLIGEMGDRTQAGHRLTEVGGRELAYPVSLEGGPNYMRAEASQGPDRGIWASDKGQVSRISNFAAREAERTGANPTLSYTAMGARGGDFSHMMSDAVLAQIAGSKIKVKDLQAFDRQMREKYPEWAGLRKPEQLRKQLTAEGAGQMRKDFAELSSLGEWTEKGFPDPGQTRLAITDPELLGQPTGVSGYSFARIDPGARPIENPAIPHTTYPTQLGGEYAGGFERTVPLEVLYPDWAQRKLEGGMRPEKLDRAFQIGNVSQLADQRWVDLVSQYLEQQRGRGP